MTSTWSARATPAHSSCCLEPLRSPLSPAVLAELERSLVRERRRKGIEPAKARGAYRGRKRSLSDGQVAEVRRRAEVGVPKAVLSASQWALVRELLRSGRCARTHLTPQRHAWAQLAAIASTSKE